MAVSNGTLSRLREFVEDLACFKEIRKIPHEMHRRIQESWQHRCAICCRTDFKLEVAHIVPVEEGGGYNESNLLLLCRRARANLVSGQGSMDVDSVGCHQLLDNEGVWSREAIRKLRETGAIGAGSLFRPQRPSLSTTVDRFRQSGEKVEHLIASRQMRRAAEMLEKLRAESQGDLDRECYLKLLTLRCARRRRGKARQQAIKLAFEGIESLHDNLLREGNREAADIVEYEMGMVCFADDEFDNAKNWLSRYREDGSRITASGWCKNEVQRCVALFEASRRCGADVVPAILAIERIIPLIDDWAVLFNSNTSQRWRVLSRLHLARMKAFVLDACAMNFVIEAERIRDSHDATSGWAPYTASLLLHTKGEAYRALGDHAEAVQSLSFAARRIIIEKYKDYEYLENVLDGLVKALRAARPRDKALAPELDRLRRAWLQERAIIRRGTVGRS